MISLYNILEEKRPQIIIALLKRVPKDIRAYARVPKQELRESAEQLLDAFFHFFVTGDETHLRRIFKYIARVRATQGFSMSAVLKALLCFLPAARETLQADVEHLDQKDANEYAQLISQIEKSAIAAAGIFTEVFQEHLQSQVDDYNKYLDEKKKQLGVDLSRFILFRA